MGSIESEWRLDFSLQIAEKWLYVPSLMKLQNSSAAATLVEFSQVAPENLGSRQIAPMQFFQHRGRGSDAENRIFVISGLQGPSKNDVHVAGLLQKALTKGLFLPLTDVFVVPVANPSSDSKQAWQSHQGHDLRKDNCPEIETIRKWIRVAKPKAVVAITLGTPGIHASGIPSSVLQRLGDILERPAGDAAAPGSLPSIQDFCAEQSILFLEISIDDSKKTFDEVRDSDWKKNIGPALKWLVEGERFNPPKEEPASLEHLVVPALEMPPEFAHL